MLSICRSRDNKRVCAICLPHGAAVRIKSIRIGAGIKQSHAVKKSTGSRARTHLGSSSAKALDADWTTSLAQLPHQENGTSNSNCLWIRDCARDICSCVCATKSSARAHRKAQPTFLVLLREDALGAGISSHIEGLMTAGDAQYPVKRNDPRKSDGASLKKVDRRMKNRSG